MAASYPAALKTFTDQVDGVDWVLAADMNAVQQEVQAIEAELGINVAGSLTNLKTRLAVLINDNGTLKTIATNVSLGGNSLELVFNDTDTARTLGESFGKIVWTTDDASVDTNDIYGEIDLVSNDNGSKPFLVFRLGDFNTAPVELMRINDLGLVSIGDTANAKMTQGLTINQGANDDEILALKSSQVAHAMTDLAETDTYGVYGRVIGASGGIKMVGFTEAGVGLELSGAVVTGDTSKTVDSYAAIETNARKKSGTGAGAMGGNENIFAITEDGAVRFLVDEDGDYHYDGADGGAFDTHDDLSLVRSFSLVTAGKGIIKSRWDEFVSHKEKDLVDLGILGDTVKNGGLVNGAQLQRLHNGAIWQLAEKIFELESKLALLEA